MSVPPPGLTAAPAPAYGQPMETENITQESPTLTAAELPVEFFRRVWAPPHDLDAVD